jgi:outer membrane immunogenic protein
MRNILVSTISAAALMIAAGQASAADMGARPMYTKAPVMAVYNWTGAYIGINGGGGWGSSNVGGDLSGGVFGGQLGYNWQNGQAVFGIETDIQWSGIDGTSTVAGSAVTVGSDWFGTVRGRLGYAFDRSLLYVTGGLAYGNVNGTSPFSSFSTTNTGWALGGGLEFALQGPWTMKVEYLHVDLGDNNLTVPAATVRNVDFSADIVRAGLNYRF